MTNFTYLNSLLDQKFAFLHKRNEVEIVIKCRKGRKCITWLQVTTRGRHKNRGCIKKQTNENWLLWAWCKPNFNKIRNIFMKMVIRCKLEWIDWIDKEIHSNLKEFSRGSSGAFENLSTSSMKALKNSFWNCLNINNNYWFRNTKTDIIINISHFQVEWTWNIFGIFHGRWFRIFHENRFRICKEFFCELWKILPS